MTRPKRRRALLIGNENYDDSRFGQLRSTQVDTWQLRQVLEHRLIGAFTSVKTVADLTADDMLGEISTFLADCEEDELALLYVSGHGTRLRQAGGEFHFVAKDSDFDRIAETGVAAGFVNEGLEQCWARQKLVLLDCCQSGGFSVGLRTSDRQAEPTAKSGEEALLTSRGVYVLSSSRAGEDSFSGAETADGVEPSPFTAEVVEALRTGKVGKNGTGEVSVGDLFEYVNKRMRAKGSKQIPVKSAHGVDDTMVLANCPLGSAPELLPMSRRPTAATEKAPASPKAVGSKPDWTNVLGYYRDCVLADETAAPLLSVRDDEDTSYVCLTGFERFLSGDLDEDDCAPVPPEATAFVEAASKAEAELWAGYPAVVLEAPRNGPAWGSPKFAPLLVRRVEVVHSGEEIRLKPYGPVLPHPRLAHDWLGEEDAARLADSYQPTWHAGQHDRMAVDVRHLLREEYALTCVQEPRPDQLADRIDIRTPGNGARNTAVLLSAPREAKFNKKLIADFDNITKKSTHIKKTALAALSPDPAERAEPLAQRSSDTVRLVTPLPSNEAQSAVLRSAMTRRLTVATGPPGTGKSQVVTNLVATAVAAGQSVLVASTNNQAVDEVWRRCEQLSPGCVVRTGPTSRERETDYAEAEANTLRTLLVAPAPERNVSTARMDVDVANDKLDHVRGELARAAQIERVLLQAGRSREEHAARLGLGVGDIAKSLGEAPELDRWARKAVRLASAWFFGERRRTRLLHHHGVRSHDGSTTDACTTLVEFVAAEATWRTAREQTLNGPGDAVLADRLADAESTVRASSAALLDSSVRTNTGAGRQRITALLTARQTGGSDWPAVRNVLPAARGWAVTSLSARRFPPDPALFDLVIIDEASQCAIPHVLPLLFRARRALIIGDAMQLTHITTLSSEREALIRRTAGLPSDWLEKHRLAYRRHSAFHAAEHATGGSLLFDEHFRCHPDIADISNRHFYDGRLTVLTDIRARPSMDRRAVIWAQVAGRAVQPPSGSSWTNPAEVDKVAASVRHLLEQLPQETGATIGVITPFKAQEKTLRTRLREHEDRVRVGTVHTFQGGECDVMIFSLVAGEGMRRHSVDWVDRQLNLWNVAITRARSHLIVVGDTELWQDRGGVGALLAQAAGATSEGAGDNEPDVLLKRLYLALSERQDTTVELGVKVHGHPVDALVRTGGTASSVLLDPGPAEGTDEARHLRLMLRRRELLGGHGDGTAIRFPAWKLYDKHPSDR